MPLHVGKSRLDTWFCLLVRRDLGPFGAPTPGGPLFFDE